MTERVRHKRSTLHPADTILLDVGHVGPVAIVIHAVRARKRDVRLRARRCRLRHSGSVICWPTRILPCQQVSSTTTCLVTGRETARWILTTTSTICTSLSTHALPILILCLRAFLPPSPPPLSLVLAVLTGQRGPTIVHLPRGSTPGRWWPRRSHARCWCACHQT